MVPKRFYILCVVVYCLLLAASPLAQAASPLDAPEPRFGGVAPLTLTGAPPLDPAEAPVDSAVAAGASGQVVDGLPLRVVHTDHRGGDGEFINFFLLACASEMGKNSILEKKTRPPIISHIAVDRLCRRR